MPNFLGAKDPSWQMIATFAWLTDTQENCARVAQVAVESSDGRNIALEAYETARPSDLWRSMDAMISRLWHRVARGDNAETTVCLWQISLLGSHRRRVSS